MRIVVGGVIQAGQPEIETLVIGPGIPLADVIDEGDDFNSLGVAPIVRGKDQGIRNDVNAGGD